jgi:hypothetical protein
MAVMQRLYYSAVFNLIFRRVDSCTNVACYLDTVNT